MLADFERNGCAAWNRVYSSSTVRSETSPSTSVDASFAWTIRISECPPKTPLAPNSCEGEGLRPVFVPCKATNFVDVDDQDVETESANEASI